MNGLLVALLLAQANPPACYNPQASCSDECQDSAGALVCSASLEVGSAQATPVTIAGAVAGTYPTITATGALDAGVAVVCPGYAGLDVVPGATGATPSFLGTTPSLGGSPALCLGQSHAGCTATDFTVESDGTNTYLNVPSVGGSLYVGFDGGYGGSGARPGLILTENYATLTATSGPNFAIYPGVSSTTAEIWSNGVTYLAGVNGALAGTANSVTTGTQLFGVADGPLVCAQATEGLDAGTCGITATHFLGGPATNPPTLTYIASGWNVASSGIAGNDLAFIVTINTGTTPAAIAAGAGAFTVNLANYYSTASFVAVLSGANEYGATAAASLGAFASAANQITFAVGSAGLTPAASTTYKFAVITMGAGAAY